MNIGFGDKNIDRKEDRGSEVYNEDKTSRYEVDPFNHLSSVQ